MNKKIWLVTGISSGMGKALADALIQREDVFLIGTFRQEEQVINFNNHYGDKALAVKLDITDQSAMDHLISMIKTRFGSIQVLVNNAGVGFAGAVEEASLEEIRNVFEANFFGPVALTQKILPLMRKEKNGHIVQISSHGGIKAFPGFGVYNASKFALEGISEALAGEVAPLGINLTIVQPGPFRTKFAGNGFQQAQHTIQDYDATAGVFRQKIKSVDGIQEGDPTKAALAIINHINKEQASLRLPLGKTATITIQSKIDSVQKDLNDNKAIAENVIFV
jgi:NAD(P)-dependent dehydrogenase (short-subunit alcohol dehydrogenase family)